MAAKSTSTRYGSVAIAIHWLTALLIVMLFATGLLAAGTTDEEIGRASCRERVL